MKNAPDVDILDDKSSDAVPPAKENRGRADQKSKVPAYKMRTVADKPAAAPNGHSAAGEPKIPKENFFNRLAQMSQDDWDKCRVYVYRRWPRISRDDQPHYIGTHRQAIDEEFIKTLYESGRYLLKLNDPKRTIDQAPLEIMDIGCPPKLDPQELTDAPENERYFRLWPPKEDKKPTAEGKPELIVALHLPSDPRILLLYESWWAFSKRWWSIEGRPPRVTMSETPWSPGR